MSTTPATTEQLNRIKSYFLFIPEYAQRRIVLKVTLLQANSLEALTRAQGFDLLKYLVKNGDYHNLIYKPATAPAPGAALP